MPNYKACLCVVMFVALTACSKEKFDPISDSTDRGSVGNCDCEVGAEEYIKANFNAKDICFSTIKNVTDTFSNAYYINSSIHLDHINIIRNNTDKTMSCQLHFINPGLHNKTLPYILPHSASGYNEYAEIILSNIGQAWSEQSSDNYVGNTYNGFSISITDTSGGYLKGTFKGQASTKQGKKVFITAGIFNVHIITVDKSK